MKKKFSYLMMIAFLAIISMVMSSCLGDTESKASGTDYVYVTYLNDTQCAYLPRLGIYITSTEIKNIQVGSIVQLSYNVNLSQITNIYNATNVVVVDATLYTPSQQGTVYRVTSLPAVTSADSAFVALPTSFSNDFSSFWGYRRLCSFTSNLIGTQTAKVELYYDENRQVDTNGLDLKNGEVVLDVRIKKGSAPSNETETAQERGAVVNLTGLHNILAEKLASESSQTFTVRVRGYIINTTTGAIEEEYRGNNYFSLYVSNKTQ